MSNNLLQAAQQFIGSIIQNKADNKLQDTPWKQSALDAIMSGDQSKGEELAQNIMKTYGFSSPQEAIQQGLQNLSRRR